MKKNMYNNFDAHIPYIFNFFLGNSNFLGNFSSSVIVWFTHNFNLKSYLLSSIF